MRWNLILPSRERPALLENLLESVMQTASDLGSVEMLVGVDDDDQSTLDQVPRLEQLYPFVRFLVERRHRNLSDGYFNRLAERSQGSYVQALNDDSLYVTPGWDELGATAFYAAKEDCPDGVLYGKCDDGLGTSYACFPVLTREARQALGWMFHPEFTTWGADVALHQLFCQVDEGRVVRLPYKVDHISHHLGKRPWDKINEQMRHHASYNFGSVPGEAARLRRIIDELCAARAS